MSYKDSMRFGSVKSIENIKKYVVPTYIIFIYLAILAPVLYSIFIATGNQMDISVLSREEFSSSLVNSLKLAFSVAIVSVILATIAARHYRNVTHKKLYVFYLILPIFIPAGTHTLAIAAVAKEIGATLNFWTLLAAHVFWTFPFAFLMLLATIAGLPQNLTQAAMDLGANELRAFFDIELPLIQDGIISAFLLSVLLSVNEATRSTTLGGSYETISGVIFSYYTSTGLTTTIYTLSSFLVIIATLITIAILFLIGLRTPATGGESSS